MAFKIASEYLKCIFNDKRIWIGKPYELAMMKEIGYLKYVAEN